VFGDLHSFPSPNMHNSVNWPLARRSIDGILKTASYMGDARRTLDEYGKMQ